MKYGLFSKSRIWAKLIYILKTMSVLRDSLIARFNARINTEGETNHTPPFTWLRASHDYFSLRLISADVFHDATSSLFCDQRRGVADAPREFSKQYKVGTIRREVHKRPLISVIGSISKSPTLLIHEKISPVMEGVWTLTDRFRVSTSRKNQHIGLEETPDCRSNWIHRISVYQLTHDSSLKSDQCGYPQRILGKMSRRKKHNEW